MIGDIKDIFNSVSGAFNVVIKEMERQDLMDYGRTQINSERYSHINKLIAGGMEVKRKAEGGGVDRKYERD